MQSLCHESKNSGLAEWRIIFRANLSFAKKFCNTLTPEQRSSLKAISRDFRLTLLAGELRLIDGHWYVTHAGLMHLSVRNRCYGIDVRPAESFCDPATSRWTFKATVYKSPKCRGFVGYGDADPSNVSALVRGAEMRVAETRAVNRALRKAYGIGICSVEEIGSFAEPNPASREAKKLPPQPVNGKNGNYGGPKSAIASASSSASISSMPTWSSPTPSISAAPRASGKPPASRSKAS
jgi:hypothetical protein